MKKNKKKSEIKSKIVLKVNKDFFKTKNNLKFTQAAKIVMRSINKHFKEDGWDLRTDYLIDEMFYLVHGEHLSDYLYKELFSNPKNGYYLSCSNKHSDIVIRKKKNV